MRVLLFLIAGLGLFPNSAHANIFDTTIYYTNAFSGFGTARSVQADGTNPVVIAQTPTVAFSGIDYDPATDKVYFIDGFTDTVNRMNSDGTNPEVLVPVPQGTQYVGLTLDLVNGKIYWVDADAGIFQSNLDGTNVVNVVPNTGAATGQRFMDGVEVDPIAEKIYFSESNTITPTAANNPVKRANLDGTNVETIVPGLRSWDIAASNDLDKIFWTRGFNDTIYTAGSDGSNPTVFFNVAGKLAHGITIAENYLFFNADNAIHKIKTDGTGFMTIRDEGIELAHIADDFQPSPGVIPEPSTFLLFGTSLLGLITRRKSS